MQLLIVIAVLAALATPLAAVVALVWTAGLRRSVESLELTVRTLQLRVDRMQGDAPSPSRAEDPEDGDEPAAETGADEPVVEPREVAAPTAPRPSALPEPIVQIPPETVPSPSTPLPEQVAVPFPRVDAPVRSSSASHHPSSSRASYQTSSRLPAGTATPDAQRPPRSTEISAR